MKTPLPAQMLAACGFAGCLILIQANVTHASQNQSEGKPKPATEDKPAAVQPVPDNGPADAARKSLPPLPEKLAEQVKDHQQKYLEGKKQAQLQQAYLESLKARVKALAAGQSDSEKTLRLLTKQLTELRQSDVASRSRHKSDISQLQFSLDTLKSKVSEKDQVICSFSQFDKHQAKEISEIIRTKMEGAKDFSRTLSKKIETAEDSANELEQLISELAIDYEMKKSQKLHYLRKRKDEFLRNSRKAREDLRLATVKNNETSRVELKFQLSAARKFHYCAEQSQIDAGRKRREVKAI